MIRKFALYEMKDVDVRRILQAYGLDRLDIIGVLNAFKSSGVRLMMEDDYKGETKSNRRMSETHGRFISLSGIPTTS